MDKKSFIIEMEFERNLDEFEYLMYKIFFHAAPTFKGVKPSSLLNFRNMPDIKLREIWNKYKGEIRDNINIEFIELKSTDECTSVLFYDKVKLKKILCENECNCFLKNMGYNNCKAVEFALHQLRENYNNECPDEIGVFLGYPLQDVKMFLDKNNTACKMARYWKAYTDIERAVATWDSYDNAQLETMNKLVSCKSPLELLYN